MYLAQIVELGGPHPAMVSALLKVKVLLISSSVACSFLLFCHFYLKSAIHVVHVGVS